MRTQGRSYEPARRAAPPARWRARVAVAVAVAGCVFGAARDGAAAGPPAAEERRAAALEHLASEPRVHPAVVEALRAAPRVRVFLQLQGTGEERGSPAQVRGARRVADGVMTCLATGFEVTHRFEELDALAGWIDAETALAAAAHPAVKRVLPDSGGKAALLQSLPLVRLSDTRAAGFTGAGLRVAIIDSGIDATHPSLSAALVDEACYCSDNCCPNGKPTQFGAGAARDQNGHGTNVTGIVAGRGIAAPQGALPAVGIVAVRVLDSHAVFSTTADLIAGLLWVHQKHPEVAAANMSLETYARYGSQCDNSYPLFVQAARLLEGDGATIVAATGNEGELWRVAAPACLSDVVGVAAVWDAQQYDAGFCGGKQVYADEITCFSNRGPMADLLAPGAAVTATGLGGGSSTYYGTSQASPMVAACATALRQANPAATVAERLHALKVSPTIIADPVGGLTYPRIDCQHSVEVITTQCGDADADDRVLASDALLVLRKSVGDEVTCATERCDFDGNGLVTAADALLTLRRAVGQQLSGNCLAGI